MDDKKFDEIMRSYVASTAKGEEHDLAKLRSKAAPVRKRRRTRAKLSAVAAAVVIAVTLSVCLPLTLGKSDSNNYLDSDLGYDNYTVVLDDVSQLAEDYGLSVVIPSAPMEMGVVASAILDKDTNAFLGAQLDCLPEEWAFSNVVCYATREGDMLPQVSDKITSPMNKFYWHGIKAHYQKEERIDNTHDIDHNPIALEVHSYWLHFDYDGVSYYVNFEIYPDNATGDFDLPEDDTEAAIYLLDFLYPDFVGQLNSDGIAVTA